MYESTYKANEASFGRLCRSQIAKIVHCITWRSFGDYTDFLFTDFLFTDFLFTDFLFTDFLYTDYITVDYITRLPVTCGTTLQDSLLPVDYINSI